MSLTELPHSPPPPGENLAAADPPMQDAAALSSCAGCRPKPVVFGRHRLEAEHWHVMAGDYLIGPGAYIYCSKKEDEARASPDGRAAP